MSLRKLAKSSSTECVKKIVNQQSKHQYETDYYLELALIIRIETSCFWFLLKGLKCCYPTNDLFFIKP